MRVISIAVLLFAGVVIAAASQAPATDGWAHAVGRDTESLHAVHTDVPPALETVALPHRVNRPNTALWYSRELDLSAGATLNVDADDGAQVFVDGERWRGRGRVFAPERPVASGRHQVVVRVLNNAVQGGLRRVTVAGTSPPPPERLPAASWFMQPESAIFAARMPAPDQPCDFTLWGDSQGGWETFSRLVSRMSDRPHHFSAGAGDLVNDGFDRQAWRRLDELLAALATRTAVVPIVGNHDYDGSYDTLVSDAYQEMFDRDRTWTAWTCGPLRVMAVDLNREFPLGIGAAQRQWIDAEVRSKAWTSAVWRVLLVHQPPYSRSWPGYDGDAPVRALAHDLLQSHGLSMVVAGHSHAYEHLVRAIDGKLLHVLITGGGGGGLEPNPTSDPSPDRVIVSHHFVRGHATTTRLEFEAVDADGNVIDRWRLDGR